MRIGSRGWAVAVAVGLLLPGTARAQISAYRLRPVERVRSPLVGTADVGGRVFEDRNGNGRLDPGEPGVPGVYVALDDGRYARTDDDGRYELPEVGPGQRRVRLRRASLPTGAAPEGPGPVIEVPPGAFVRVDLPVRLMTDTVRIGRPAKIGWALTSTLQELPVNVVGNATDIQALENGRRLRFPTADVRYTGLDRGGFVRPKRLRRVRVILESHGRGTPVRWQLTLATGAGKVLHTFEHAGAPPRILRLDRRTLAGVKIPAPGAYVFRLCVTRKGGRGACSPYRPFGLETGRGSRRQRPKLAVPDVTSKAIIAGESAHLDPDGSFILAAHPDAKRRVTLRLLRDDGREAHTVFTLPSMGLAQPAGPVAITWGRHTQVYQAPSSPGPVEVHLEGPVTTGARIVLGRARLQVAGRRWRHDATVAAGRSRLEVTVTAASGFNTLYEIRFRLSNQTPAGRPNVVEKAVPKLRVTLPVATAPLTSGTVRIRGRSIPGATLVAGTTPVPVGKDGRFDALVPVPTGTGRLVLVVRDRSGDTGRVTRTWRPALSGTAIGVLGDGEPYVRIVHRHALPGDAGAHFGLAGAVRADVDGWHRRGLHLFAGLSLFPASRTTGQVAGPDVVAGAALRAGVEGYVGRRIVLGARYDGVVFAGPGAGSVPPMRHTATFTGALLGRHVDVLVDAGADDNRQVGRPASFLAGGGLGVRWRATRSLDVRLRIGAAVSLTKTTAGTKPELVDASGQVTWQSPFGALVSLRLAHVEDRRGLDPEAAGEIAHLALDVPLGRRMHLMEVLGGWLSRGAFTGLDVTRLELVPMSGVLVAVDYRLETQSSATDHALRLEGDYLLGSHLRLGVMYELRDVTAGGEMSSLLQGRLEVLF